MTEEKFDLWDIAIVPSTWSVINSRSEIDTHVKFGKLKRLPLMAAPMDTVVSNDNINTFIANNIIPCMPRGQRANISKIDTSQYFQAFGLQEIEIQLENYIHLNEKAEFSTFDNILIDIANGHMKKLVNLVKEIKKHFPTIKIMVGNIANPYTYANLADAGADYIRCSIGTGCFTPGQIIKLNNIKKNIEDIKIGDKVLTHKNRYQIVKNKFEYLTSEEIYKINDITCTKTHEFYVIEKQYEHIVNDDNLEQYAKWISANELNKEKHLLIEY